MLHSAESAFVAGTSEDRRRRAPVAAADSVARPGYGNQAMLRMRERGAKQPLPSVASSGLTPPLLQRQKDHRHVTAGAPTAADQPTKAAGEPDEEGGGKKFRIKERTRAFLAQYDPMDYFETVAYGGNYNAAVANNGFLAGGYELFKIVDIGNIGGTMGAYYFIRSSDAASAEPQKMSPIEATLDVPPRQFRDQLAMGPGVKEHDARPGNVFPVAPGDTLSIDRFRALANFISSTGPYPPGGNTGGTRNGQSVGTSPPQNGDLGSDLTAFLRLFAAGVVKNRAKIKSLNIRVQNSCGTGVVKFYAIQSAKSVAENVVALLRNCGVSSAITITTSYNTITCDGGPDACGDSVSIDVN
ncbi:MAG TPA: hypothetical protein VG986_15675 [Pseudolabrys sp.]|nr:hypothetical protein [Pseudolabrys sp.]